MKLIPATKGHPLVRGWMAAHYSAPKGFVGRQLIYLVTAGGACYGAIAGGSATLHLAGRDEALFGMPIASIVNNTFFHVQKVDGCYPERNFTTAVVAAWREQVALDWEQRYGDEVLGFETLVELPRSGELYSRDGWKEVGMTKGYTCKRVGGTGTDSWSGRRVWDVANLRPKRVFTRAR